MNEPKKRTDVDRRLRQANRHARTIRVLQLIQSKGRWTASSIAAELECSERTIYRDLDVLELAGVPWYFSEEERCYRVRPDFRFPVVNVTDDELLGQVVATAIAAAPGLNIGPGAKSVTRKISAAANDKSSKLIEDAERVIEVLDLKLADHSRSHEVIRTVQWALLQGRQVSGHYASPYQPKPQRITLHPYRLCLTHQAWYLIARPDRETNAKTFRITRFKSLRMLNLSSVVPEKFDLNAYFGNAWGVYRGAETFEVAVEFSKEAAPLAMETSWHRTQRVKQHKGGGVTLEFTIDGLDEIVWWVLGWSSRAKVLRPEKLRSMVVERLRAALRLNE